MKRETVIAQWIKKSDAFGLAIHATEDALSSWAVVGMLKDTYSKDFKELFAALMVGTDWTEVKNIMAQEALQMVADL